MDGAPDSELLSRAARGDADAFGLIADRYAPSLYDFAARLTRDRDEAFEVVRETFLVAAHTVRAHPVTVEAAPWLFALARANVLAIVDGAPRPAVHLEGRSEPPQPLDSVDDSPFELPGEAADASALAPAVWESATTLDSRQLGILLLVRRAGFSAEEAAGIFGMHAQSGAVIVPRLERAAEDSAWALLMLRDPARRCAGLSALLAAEEPTAALAPPTRRSISRHMASCPDCARMRASSPELLAVFAALAPAAMPAADAAALRATVLAESATAAPPPPPVAPPIALLPPPGPRRSRVLAAFAGLACVAGVLGGLLLVPASPIALTRDRVEHEPPLVIVPPPTPEIIYITPTPGSPTPTPAAPSATPSPRASATPGLATAQGSGATLLPEDSPTSDTSSPTPSPTVTRVAQKTPTTTPETPTPIGGGTNCTPSLSTNVRQVNIAGGSSSFTIFNSFCRAVQYSLDVTEGNSWLHLQQEFGTLQPGDFATIGITAERAVLPEGTTTGALSLTWVDGSLDIPVSVTISGGAPIVGPVQATCGPGDQADSFSARVIDDYGVDTVTVTVVSPDGTSTTVPMTRASGDPKAGDWTAEPQGPIASYTITAADFAGHTGVFPGTCSQQ